MLIFRRAEAHDLPEILRVVHEAQAFMRTLEVDQWQDGYPDEVILREDIEIGQAYVYADDERQCIASIAVFSTLPEPAYDALDGEWCTQGDYLTLHRVAIDDVHRGSGLAGKMLQEGLALAKRAHLPSLRTDTHRGNLAMRRFLEKSGFTYCGEVLYPISTGDPIRVAYERIIVLH